MGTIDRRSMLKAELSGAGAFLNLNPRAMGANERGSLGLIGGRNQGKWAALRAIEAGAEIRSPCDIDDAILGETGPALAKAQGREPLAVKDFRRVLDDKSIDAVIIATPDHWHTHIGLLACHAGKDVYIEKPLSQTVREGQMIRDAARKYSRIMQVGTQRRSGEHFASAADYVASGKLGKVCLVKAWMCQVRPSIGNPARSGPSTDGGLRCLARPRPQAAIQPESFPLQLALLLGLWQQ